MDIHATLLYKTFVVGIIFIFVGICIIPTVNSIMSKDNKCLYLKSGNSDLFTQLDVNLFDIKNSFNSWIYQSQTLRNFHNTINTSVKPNELIKVKESSKQTSSSTLYVGGSGPGNYTDIQDAINDASDGDTVFVFDDSSPYYERDIYVSKSIKLIGENKETTIIDGKRKFKNELAWGISISADGVTISGFTIQNFINPIGFILPGIWIVSSNNIITGNIFTNNNYGILLDGRSYPANYNTVTNNIINCNSRSGVYILSSNNNIISMNTFSDNYYYGGLSLHTSKYNDISENVFNNDGVWIYISYKNTFLNNSVNDKPFVYLEEESNKVIEENAGQVILIKCDNITIQNLDISNTTIGIALDQTNNCLISNNKISSHFYSGILFVQSFNNNISTNIFSNEDENSIFLFYSNGNSIFSNTIKSSSWVGILIGYSNYNDILTNTFYDNNGGLSLSDSNYNNVFDNVFYNDGIFVYNAWNNNFQKNYVNEKPLVYLEDESDIIINEPAGQVFLLNCDNITVTNQDISNAFVGILLMYTENSFISGNIISSCINYAIFLTHSISNNISFNSISDNHNGITLDTSHENIIFNNNLELNRVYGIWLSDSNYNNITYNIIKKNGGRRWIDYGRGLNLAWSFNNEIHYNNFLHNANAAYFAESSSTNWDFNYWNRPRLLPKIIFGGVASLLFRIRINIDRHPAKKPYDIEV